MAVTRANIELDVGQKISFVNVFSGDPRLRVLAKLQGTNNPMEFQAPTLVVERKSMQRYFGNVFNQFSHRAIIHSVFSEEQYFLILDQYLMRQ